MKFFKSALFLLLIEISTVYGLPLESEVNLTGGYRNDTLYSKDSKQNSLSLNGEKQTFHLKNVANWQMGLDGRLMLPGLTQPSWLNHFYVDGFAFFGKSPGKADLYRKKEAASSLTSKEKSSVRFKTYDSQIGLGYLVDTEMLKIGVLGGYGFNQQKITDSKKNKTNFKKLNLIWEGPWTGVEFFYKVYQLTLGAGYEFHWVNFQRSYHEIQDFKTSGKSSKAYGNRIFLSSHYHFCTGLSLGLNVNFQAWDAKKVHLNQSAQNGRLSQGRNKTNWRSYAVVVDFGYWF